MDKIENVNALSASYLFAAPVYIIEKPEFLSVTKKVAKKYLAKQKRTQDLNPMFPVYMTENINFEPEMLDFANYVAQTSWNILSEQGYAMDGFSTHFTEMWCQEHHQSSLMEKHIHGNGSQISGFYFLDCPKDSSRVVFHDPRDSKVITSLPEQFVSNATHASNMINFEPKEGMLMFSNSWLPHSFTKNTNKKPIRFIHFNVSVSRAPQTCMPQAEVI